MRSPAERKIAEAIENGEFDNLPGKGRPLTLDDLARDENLAHRLLVDNGFPLPWIELKGQIDADLEKAVRRLSQRLEWLQGQGEAQESSRRWAVAVEEFRLAIQELNQRIDECNLRVPLAQFQRRRIDADAELERLNSD
jgi:DnaJ family protein C protein 28